MEAFVDLLPIIDNCPVVEGEPRGTYICCAERRQQSQFLKLVEESTQWCLDLRDDTYEISVLVNELLFLVINDPFSCIMEPIFDVGYLKFSRFGASLDLRMIEQKSFLFKSTWKPYFNLHLVERFSTYGNVQALMSTDPEAMFVHRSDRIEMYHCLPLSQRTSYQYPEDAPRVRLFDLAF